MLTDQHLRILRAALQFFDEELSPHGTDAIVDYVEDVTPTDVTDLRGLLEAAHIIAVDTRERTVVLRFERNGPDLEVDSHAVE